MEELVHELSQSMRPNTVFHLFGIPITDTIVSMWIVMALLIVVAYFLGRKLEMVPSRSQGMGEVIVESIGEMVKDAIGHHWRGFAPYIGTILMFLALANVISIFNLLPHWKQLAHLTGIESLGSLPTVYLRPPTKDINVTACMATMSIVLVIGAGLKYHKLSGFIKGLFQPIPALFPFKILDYLIKPLSLCLRLFGNIPAAFTIMELIYFAAKSFIKFLIPVAIPSMASLYFDLFDGLLQAYIFAFLTSLYIGEAVEEDEL